MNEWNNCKTDSFNLRRRIGGHLTILWLWWSTCWLMDRKVLQRNFRVTEM